MSGSQGRGIGRGRGRGLGALAMPPLRRPGEDSINQNNNNTKSKPESLQSILNDVGEKASEDEIKAVRGTCQMYAKTKEDVKEMARIIHERALHDTGFISIGATLCHKLAGIDADGFKFRSAILSRVQSDFKDKDKMRRSSKSKFLNSVRFLCQIFNKLRDANDQPLQPLASPVCECLELLLSKTASDMELECAAEQLSEIGHVLESCNSKGVDNLLHTIKTQIVLNSSPKVRLSMLQLLDLNYHGWNALPDTVGNFYNTVL